MLFFCNWYGQISARDIVRPIHLYQFFSSTEIFLWFFHIWVHVEFIFFFLYFFSSYSFILLLYEKQTPVIKTLSKSSFICVKTCPWALFFYINDTVFFWLLNTFCSSYFIMHAQLCYKDSSKSLLFYIYLHWTVFVIY